MTRVKIFITLFVVATIIVAGIHVYGWLLAVWSIICVIVGWVLTALWNLKKYEP